MYGQGRRFEVVGDVMGVGEDGTPLMQFSPGHVLPSPAGPRPNVIMLPPRPGWRDGQLAPGVMQPDEGLVPLPLTPLQGGGTFVAATPVITFQGQLQKPFRAERYLIQTVKTGATATANFVVGTIFVGTDLQQADIGNLPLELLGPANAFGTRLTLQQAPPGVLIRIVATTATALTAPDSIATTMTFLGRIIH